MDERQVSDIHNVYQPGAANVTGKKTAGKNHSSASCFVDMKRDFTVVPS